MNQKPNYGNWVPEKLLYLTFGGEMCIRDRAYSILKEAKDVADETIRNFNKYGKAGAPVSEMEKERTKLRGKMDKAAQKMSEQKKASVPNHNVPKKLRIGDSVKVISMNLKGTVHSLPNARGDLYVQMGILRSLVNINDLILLEEDATPGTKKFQKTSAGKIKMSKSASVSTAVSYTHLSVPDRYTECPDCWTASRSTALTRRSRGL